MRRRGDWSVKRPDLEPSGWAFEFANEYYPDIDDTAMVLLALLHAKASDPVRQERVERRAINWLLGMQSSDGGWAAFDVDNNWAILNSVPFADHNAMLDPSCPDITGRVLESLCAAWIRRGASGRQARRRVAAQPSGRRWKLVRTLGRELRLRHFPGHARIEVRAGGRGASGHAEGCRLAARRQNADGGWGESAAGYRVNRFVAAPSTPSQTAWALLGLLAAGDRASDAVRGGVEYLTSTQKSDGTWDEALFTGTGFPNVFYLQYHMYRDYFPLLALTECRAAMGRP